MIDFTKVPNIHYWTQRVLPCVFDESLSYVEKINKLEEEINKLIEEYNKFGQNVVTEINTFEEETTNQINTFIQQITNEINTFKSDITNQLNTFETTITNRQNAFETRILELTQEFETTINNDIATFKQTMTTQQEQFETRVNNDINTMQEVVNEIPNTVTTQVNAITQPWLVANVPAMVESSVANNVNKVFDVDQLYNSGTSEQIQEFILELQIVNFLIFQKVLAVDIILCVLSGIQQTQVYMTHCNRIYIFLMEICITGHNQILKSGIIGINQIFQ